MESEQARWHLEMLGGLCARRGDRVIGRFQTHKTGLLLAFLAYYPHRRHSREELVDLLWPEAELDAGRNRLSQAVGWLRSQLEPPGTPRGSILQADRQTVGLDPQAITTDAAEFEAAIRSVGLATDGPAMPSQIAVLQRAAMLYQGDFLTGYYEDWVLRERQRLLALALSALRRLILHAERVGDWESGLDYARRALAAEPLDEELHCDLMRLLAASGQPAAALRQFRDLERVLSRELGATPSPATLAFVDRLRQGTPPPTNVLPNVVSAAALPAQLTRFFGREAEIVQVQRLIQTPGTRLVTLIGPGGVGKTRLAIEAAARLSGIFEGAVWFLPLADLREAALIPTALADLLRLSRSGSASIQEQIVAALSPRPALLVLDNLEHILDGAVPFVRDLLEQVPALTVLITSRQRLNLAGEWEITVPPLPSPVGEKTDPTPISPESLMRIDSVRLFTDRAQAVRPSFAVTPQNAPDVALLCARLEGLPLAIELCASWAQTLTPAQMLAQLTRRFDLLVSRRTDITPRHRTLRAALEYSYLLLPPDLQEFFIKLSVFRGGWTLESASAVCLDGAAGQTPLTALAAITELRERSLIVVEEATGEMRYRMLETLREFAAELWTLAVEGPLRRRHAEFFLALAEQAETYMTTPDQAVWLTRLETEHDNFRAALGWSLESRSAETGSRLAAALTPFWDVRGYLAEGQARLDGFLALTPAADGSPDAAAVRAKALNARGNLARARGDFAAAEASAWEALQLWQERGDKRGMAASLQLLATLAYSREDYAGARGFLEQALRLAREIGQSSLVAGAMMNLGNIAMELHDWPQAAAFYEESLELHRSEGNPKRIADTLNNMGLVARYRGDLPVARRLLEDSLVICRELSDRSGTAITLLNLGTVYRLQADLAKSRAALVQAAHLTTEVDNKRALAWCLKELGHLACAEGRYEAGVRLLSASESLKLALGISFSPADPQQLAEDTLRARSALGDPSFDAAWASGGQLSAEAAVAAAVPSA